MCVCSTLTLSQPSHYRRSGVLMRPGRLRNPECPALGRQAWAFCSIPLDMILLWKLTTDFTCFWSWDSPCSPDGCTLSDKQAATARAVLLFASKGEKSFSTPAKPDYAAQGCVLYGWACNRICRRHKTLQAAVCTRAAGENDALCWQKRGSASQDQRASSSVMCDFSHTLNKGVCCWDCMADLQDPERGGNTVFGVHCC